MVGGQRNCFVKQTILPPQTTHFSIIFFKAVGDK